MEAIGSKKLDIWASSALFLALGLNVVFDFVFKREFLAQPRSNSSYITLLVVWPFMAVLYYYIRKGFKGAKTSFLIIYALVLFNVLSGGWLTKACSTPLRTFDFISQHILQLTASVMLIISLMQAKNKSHQHEGSIAN